MFSLDSLSRPLLVYAFWTMPHGPARFVAMNPFLEHIGRIGSLVVSAWSRNTRDVIEVAYGALGRSANANSWFCLSFTIGLQ